MMGKRINLDIVILLGMLFIVLPIILCEGCGGCFEPEHGTDIEAWMVSEQFVEKRLVSPGSARYTRTSVKSLGDNCYEVNGYVDSQNYLGGTLRTYFKTKVKYIEYNDSWDLESIEMY